MRNELAVNQTEQNVETVIFQSSDQISAAQNAMTNGHRIIQSGFNDELQQYVIVSKATYENALRIRRYHLLSKNIEPLHMTAHKCNKCKVT